MDREEERDVRVGDYLDDKLQTLTDLDSLDALLSSVRNQHVLLKKQLEDAEKDQREAKSASEQHTTSIQQQAQHFKKHQQDIDRRLQIITQSDTSSDAVRRFEASMDKLRQMYVADGYIQRLKDVDHLSRTCLSNLGKSDGIALDAYSQLHDLSAQLPALQDAAEGAAPHLTDHVSRTAEHLHRQIEKAFATQLEKVLKKMNWPTPGMTVPIALAKEFGEAVRKLLDLQKPELETKNPSSPPLVLLPLQIMVRPLELGFKYHFEGDRPTNRLDRPEYFLAHITDKLLNQYVDFMAENLQPILIEVFRGSKLAFNAAYIDSTSALITAILPMVRNKIFAILPKISSQPQLLSHLIHEIMSFDVTIRNDWRYDGGQADESWRGLAYEVLSRDDWFATWLHVEKEFALARYHEVADAPDNFDLDYDSFGLGTTKPTKAAIRVNDLLETTTDHYRTLSSFSQKLRFLIDIQISIFDLFHERLSDGLAVYLSRISMIGRTSREDQASLQGVAGLESLCKMYGSAEYLEKAMRDWSDDIFFLELWTELQARASQRSNQNTVAGELTLEQVASRTSAAVGAEESADASGALFDETASSYQRIRVRCENLIMELLNNNVRSTLTAYTRINPWATLHSTTASQHPTAELDALLSMLSSHLSFLSRTLGRVPLRKVSRAATQTIDQILFDQVLLRHSFSAAGALQFSTDISAILSILDKYVGAGVAEFGLRRVREGSSLVGLPIRGSKDSNSENGEEDEDGNIPLGLWEVEKRMFEASGEEARACLEELGFERLSVAEGRKVLARRVEVGS